MAIVGGGLTGCAVAYALARAGVKPMLLEAGRIGEAGTAHSAGIARSEPPASVRDLHQAHGLRAARFAFEAWHQGVTDGLALLKQAKVKCGLVPVDGVTVPFDADPRPLQREYEARAAAGLDAAMLTAKQVTAVMHREAGSGLRSRGGFWLDPYRACIGLAAAAGRNRAQLFEKTPVKKVRAESDHVLLTLDHGEVRAGVVIVTTGAATAEFAPLRRHFKPRTRYLVATEPVDASLRRQLPGVGATLRDLATPPHTFRWTDDHRFIVSGGDQDTPAAKVRDAVQVQRTGQLMYELLMLYPMIAGLRPQFGWDVSFGVTADGLPYIGPHRNYPRHLFALGGDDDVTTAFLAARILTGRVRGAAEKRDEVFGWAR